MLPNQRSYSLVHGCTITRQTKCTVVCLCVYVWGCGAGKGVAEKKCRRSFFNIFDPAVFNGIELVAGINKGFDICPHKSLISSHTVIVFIFAVEMFAVFQFSTYSRVLKFADFVKFFYYSLIKNHINRYLSSRI